MGLKLPVNLGFERPWELGFVTCMGTKNVHVNLSCGEPYLATRLSNVHGPQCPSKFQYCRVHRWTAGTGHSYIRGPKYSCQFQFWRSHGIRLSNAHGSQPFCKSEFRRTLVIARLTCMRSNVAVNFYYCQFWGTLEPAPSNVHGPKSFFKS